MFDTDSPTDICGVGVQGGTLIGMTNGEKFKEVFQISQVDDCDLNVYAWLPSHDAIEIPVEWWNAEYKEPTTKNDLGVDWESYKDVDGNSLDDLILEVLQNNFDCGNTYGYKVADEIIGLLPSTPQEPILDKIRAEIETKYGQCDICEYFEDYDYEENDISEYRPIGDIADILQIIDKYKTESEDKE